MSGRIHPLVVRAVIDGVRRIAPATLPEPGILDALFDDDALGVRLEAYRAVLDHVMAHGGASALLAAGGALSELHHPFQFVLLNSDTPRQLIDKERRLARFIHSRHGVRIVRESSLGMTLEHEHVGAEPPRVAEDLAACGQHLALLSAIGCQGLRVRFPRADASTWIEVGALTRGELPQLEVDARDALGGRYAEWELAWTRFARARQPMPGLDELLLGGVDERELEERAPVVADLERVVRRDLARSWRLDEVARETGRSVRTFQRALTSLGTSFRSELDRVRVEESRRLLEGSRLSATEIGYLCGFADQAHFGRRFRRRFGCSPGAFRSQSAR